MAQVEMFPDVMVVEPPTNYEVSEKLVVARDAARTLLTQLNVVISIHDSNERVGHNPFTVLTIDKKTAEQLHESVLLIYTCLDTAINRYWSIETTV